MRTVRKIDNGDTKVASDVDISFASLGNSSETGRYDSVLSNSSKLMSKEFVESFELRFGLKNSPGSVSSLPIASYFDASIPELITSVSES